MTQDKNLIKREGVVMEALPSLLFRVNLKEGGQEVLAHLGGKLKLNRIRVIPGDKVVVEMTPYDDRRGRIVRRL